MSDVCPCVCARSTESPAQGGRGADIMELGEQQSCSAPSGSSAEKQANKQLHQPTGSARNFSCVPRPHVSPSVFNAGSSANSAANDNVDLSNEFFCQATETPSTRQSGSELGTRTGSVRSALTRDSQKFGDGFLPVLQENIYDDALRNPSQRRRRLWRTIFSANDR